MKLKTLESAGFLFGIILGVSLHFAYELSGFSKIAALFSPVNESTWEHLKLLFLPYIIFAIFEFVMLSGKYCALIPAKTLGVLIGMLLIIVLFYGYKLLFGESSLAYDISIFCISVAAAYFVSYKVLASPDDRYCEKTTQIISTLIITVFLVLFLTATFFPPHTFLFKDPITGGFGIV